MIRTLRSEWIKLRTVLVHWLLVIFAILFPLVIVTLTAIFGDTAGSARSRDFASLIAGLSVVSAMLLGSLSAISLTSEYSHNTIRPTYAATPHRLRVVASKLTVNTVIVLTVMLASVFAGWTIVSVILSGRDAAVSIGDDGVLRRLIGVCLLGVVVAWFGFALGLLIRNSPATVTIALLWPLLIESLVGGLFIAVGWEGVAKWLPYRAGISAAVGDGGGGGGDGFDELGWPGGLIWFAALTLVLVALGAWLDHRRDA